MSRQLRNPWLFLLALFVAGELIVRVFFARNMSGRFEYGYHPTAGFVEKADGTVQLPPELLDALPPGSLARAVRHDAGIDLRRVADTGTGEGEH